MNPTRLRAVSWWAFKAMFVAAVVGIALIVAVPGPGFRDPADTTVRLLATGGVGLAGGAAVASLVSLVSGAVAWSRGGGRCPWVFVCLFLLLAPLAILILSWLNV